MYALVESNNFYVSRERVFQPPDDYDLLPLQTLISAQLRPLGE